MKATFGAGCFWGVQQAFDELNVETMVGFMGGDKKANYALVCTGVTGHAEVVQVTYDPAIISYDELLEKFFKIHDPTQMNRQGPDIGSQYRSVIFYHSEEQKSKALKKISELVKQGVDVATQLEPAKTFYPASEYHQKYYQKHKTMSC